MGGRHGPLLCCCLRCVRQDLGWGWQLEHVMESFTFVPLYSASELLVQAPKWWLLPWHALAALLRY